jgi:hypothetical protein
MKVIKLFMNRETEPRFFEFIREGEKKLDHLWLFEGWLLVAYPLDKPVSKRSAKWIDPSQCRVDWIKEFV